ncbi:hypothetical protein IQ254_20925 [Nodosilinea sp. LEGE 07088]|uniref:hypothetical protein n=1 Tax=Nodosilinea sp. LEGE 07088 TaxID=2777968 RepID=UPI00188186DE|nr:hypothetical protein [Nodosilinea sp. LEGE 07088]MBE9139630.1 hypothetical protein [Nodosilinea sp. LEGE 07088]
MKHADSDTLAQLAPLLTQVRQRIPPLKEKGVGKFYLKSTAFLHFHQDSAGLFADLKVDGDWQRYPVNDLADYTLLLATLDLQLPGSP